MKNASQIEPPEFKGLGQDLARSGRRVVFPKPRVGIRFYEEVMAIADETELESPAMGSQERTEKIVANCRVRIGFYGFLERRRPRGVQQSFSTARQRNYQTCSMPQHPACALRNCDQVRNEIVHAMAQSA